MGHGDVKCEHEKTTDVGPICPECAAPTSLRTVPPPWPMRRKILVQLAALILVIGYVVWRNVEAWPILPPPTVTASVPFSPEFPTHRFSRDDIERYASGEIADGRLMGNLYNMLMLDHYELGATFVLPAGEGTHFRRYGWPIHVLIYRYDAKYDDVYAKTNPSANPSTFKNGWYWKRTYISKKIDDQGRRKTFAFDAFTLAGIPVAILAAWGAGRLLRWLALAIHVGRRDGARRRDWLVRRAPQVCAMIGVVGVTAASLVPQFDPDYAFPADFKLPLTPTGVWTSDLERMADEPSGEAKLARAILNATADAVVSPDECLAFGYRSDLGGSHSSEGGGWPIGLFYNSTYEYTGFDATDSRRLSFSRGRGQFKITARWDEDSQRVESYSVRHDRLSIIVLWLAGAWMAAGFGVWMTGWWVRRRSARRAERGQCVRCGYDLRGL